MGRETLAPAPARATAGLADPVAELGRVRRGRPGGAGAPRRAADDADADLAVPAVEDVAAVPRGVHPGAHDPCRRRRPAGAPGEVLAQRPGAHAAQIAGALHAGHHRRTGRRDVGEEALADHQPRVARGDLAEHALLAQARQAVEGSLAVEEAERRVAHRDAVLGRRAQMRAAAPGGRGPGGQDEDERQRERGQPETKSRHERLMWDWWWWERSSRRQGGMPPRPGSRPLNPRGSRSRLTLAGAADPRSRAA